MSLTDQIDDIMIRNGLKQPPEPQPEPELEPNVPDPYDDIFCPKCECNAWRVIEEKQHTVKRKSEGGGRIPVLVRKLRIQCENRFCGHQWPFAIREDL